MATIVSYSGNELQEMKDEVDLLKEESAYEKGILEERLKNVGLDGTAKELLQKSITATEDMLKQLDEKIKKFQESVEEEQGNEKDVLAKVKAEWEK